MSVNIITRDMWHALPHKAQYKVTCCNHVFWMNVRFQKCANRLECTAVLNQHQRYQMNKQNLRDIRYNFVVGGDGNVYEGRGWDVEPMTPKEVESMNKSSLVIGFLGLFNKFTLPEVMRKAAEALTEYGVANKHIHSDYELHDLMDIQPSAKPRPNP